jgi:diaminopimelate epimerase
MERIAFQKYHGTGNDFILIDDRENSFPESYELIMNMCDRHFGIGADGLILLRKKAGYDFEMKYFNSDGNESTMCGNGGRCITAFADYLSLVGQKVSFYAVDGEHRAEIISRSGQEWHVRLKMSDVDNIDDSGEKYQLDTGSPHLVLFKDEVDTLEVYEEGRRIRYSKPYEVTGINVDFVCRKDEGLFVRTYERGVEQETLSCGTGVTASALAWAKKEHLSEGKIKIETPGGRLLVTFNSGMKGFEDIWLEGPAKLVFEGTYYY